MRGNLCAYTSRRHSRQNGCPFGQSASNLESVSPILLRQTAQVESSMMGTTRIVEATVARATAGRSVSRRAGRAPLTGPDEVEAIQPDAQVWMRARNGYFYKKRTSEPSRS
jgi:hypothetical protein